ncbi:uncharacterized protein PV09_03481 [Verruconis gallopava]|uniref:E3 ubiquitin-protein ligase listerin n=1 Tax=Verruconis gallopava TaxID=253628 RepID=A0A0D2AGD3_9PEZI|nr:uncharacterized protein PV09_03481 [Verruconis gallopava]KIW05610.1 hypothetical protein PV09_03481 [Verruconis gallopava]
MSKKQFKHSASAARAFGTASPAFGFSASPGFGASPSPLSYLNELPNLSSISDSNIVVAFKNLSKRDSITKTKALEDLQGQLIDRGGDIEDGILEAWTNVYPRTSIDTERRVRQLAHTLQGHIAAKSGKRIAKRMPIVVGAWLAGLYDTDKAVAKAASESLSQVFATAEKRQALWRAYQDPLLDFCRDVFDKESPQTLSDERSVSPDEANAKYSRVVISSLGLLSNLMSELREEDFQKNDSRYLKALQDKKLWEQALSEDIGVRKSTHKMLRIVLESPLAKSCLDLDTLSKIYLTKGMKSNQKGSADYYLEALIALTTAESTIWTERWRDSKRPSSRLEEFVRRGSQGAALNYWRSLSKLFKALPRETLPSDPKSARDLIEALHSGVTHKDEPRHYISEGLATYVQVAIVLSCVLADGDRVPFLADSIFPIISQYILPKAENAKWDIPQTTAQSLLTDMVKNEGLTSMLLNEVTSLSAKLVREIRLSLPEQAKEYSRSQDDLGKAGERFAAFIAALTPPETMPERLENATASALDESLSVLIQRNGKPYGAAIVASAIIKQCRHLIDASDRLATTVEDFLDKHIAMIFVSPSYKQLATLLSACEDQEEVFVPAWTRCLNAVLGDVSDRRFPALTELLACRKVFSESELQHLGPTLVPEIIPMLDEICKSNRKWDAILPLLRDSAITSKLLGDLILRRITMCLIDAESDTSIALDGLRVVMKSCPRILKNFLTTDDGKQLLPNLLLLSEELNERLSKEAKELIPELQTLFANEMTSGETSNAIIDVIQNGLNSAGSISVSIDTLVNYAKRLLDTNMVQSMDSVLPNTGIWYESLQYFLRKPIDKSHAMTSPLGGAVYLVRESIDASTLTDIERDQNGLSVPLRMAMYTVKLFSDTLRDARTISAELFRLLTLTGLMANDHLSVYDPSNLWSSSQLDVLDDASEFVSSCQQILRKYHESNKSNLMVQTEGYSCEAYYLALGDCKIRNQNDEIARSSSTTLEEAESLLKRHRAQGNVFSILATLYGYQIALSASSQVMRYCNELIADLTPLDSEMLKEDGLSQFVILNTILTYYDDVGETIAKPRLSRFISKSVAWLQDESIDDALVAEIYRMMKQLLPLVSNLYGDYWKIILDSIKSNLELISELPDPNAPALIPAIHASIQLFAIIRRIVSSEKCKEEEDERNDDIIEAWNEHENGIHAAIVNSLKVTRHVSDDEHQPLMILNELLSREVSRILTSKLECVEDLYPQLYSTSPAVQQAAYRLLHHYIPSKQEQISLDTVLEKTKARLPYELLSLVLQAPVASDFVEEDFERSVPLQLRGYLLSWLLIFDHFSNASHKVRNDYVDSMKEAGHLKDFLDFAFDFLGHSRGRPLEVTKFDVASYNSSAMADEPLKDTQWLITHLYYLCLTHFPSLSKTWWIECESRQKHISVETWTAKFISPLVISNALEAVVSWSTTQEMARNSEQPPPLVIRVNHRASELTASYPMDDEGQSAMVVVSLPPTFPLHNAKVSSPSKAMAVEERRWNTWLINSEAIIAFSNNSIIDGLLAWRRNVFGALKGQTECAICYSVVGEDGRVPGKKCRTCKNSFHGICLFKWFKSSNGTSCPLCRERFNYG